MTYNWSFYFGDGSGNVDNWLLFAALPGILGMIGWLYWRRVYNPHSNRENFLFGSRIYAAGLLTWLSPTVYFLTHEVNIHYYLVPSTLGAALIFAGGFYLREIKAAAHRAERETFAPTAVRGFARWLYAGILALALMPGVVVAWESWRAAPPDELVELLPHDFALPEELQDERAWIWSDELSGTIWYYTQRPAYKINFLPLDARTRLFDFVKQRGEPQYIVADSDDMKLILRDLQEAGAQLELRGQINGRNYYLIHA